MTPPTAIGHYQVTSKLGEGGMGAVYRATDTRLNREVAIKVLPDALANDPDYLARFQREAQVLASLNHPNIAILHGIEANALVMELVPGKTLAERIAGGPIPLEEALDIARQIAEALEAAHEKGVIHRDLKPANVKVTPEGVVKVLDFGLAKAAEPASSAAVANSPTLTIRATQAGLILGTAGYMAPEQAAGKVVDRRADIWSFGVVLYELLSGTTLFTGETISHTLASVLKDRIDFDIPQAPPPIRRLLARCLHRDPKDRLRDIGEARIAIKSYLANPEGEPPPASTARQSAAPTRARWIPWSVCAILCLALAAVVQWSLRPSPPPPVARFAVNLDDGQVFTSLARLALAVSPDGTQLVYVANRRLYLRSLSELDARPIPGTEGAGAVTLPLFSPDGKWIVYLDLAAAAFKRIPITGGAASTICQYPNVNSATWSDLGILFAASGKGILRVSPNGGQPEMLLPAKENEAVSYPQLLPGGEAVMFALATTEASAGNRWDNGKIVVQNLKSGERKTVVEGGSNGQYLPTGHIVYAQNGVLFAVPFNLRRLETTGGAVSIVEGVLRAGNTAHFAVSNSGALIFLPGPVTAGGNQNLLALVDRKGNPEPLKIAAGVYAHPRAARDGRHIAWQTDEGKDASIWVGDLTGATAPRRLTLPGSGGNRYPVWSSDGQRIAFQSDREGDFAIWQQRADGSGIAERLTKPAAGSSHIPDSWSPDGQTLSFTEDKAGSSEVWTLSLRDRKTTVLASAPGAFLGRSAFSPDGRWVAYQMSAQPNSRIYVRPFPPSAIAYVAPEDADSHHPVWSPDGRELFYVPGSSMAGSVTISTAPSVTFGSPVRAPKSGFATQVPSAVRTYDLLPDGKRFIGVVPLAQAQAGNGGAQFRVVLNWFEDVKQRAPVR